MTASPASRARRRLVAVGVALIAVAGAGCGSAGYSEGTGDRGRGKELFLQKCGSCHTLADAGTTGTIGPDLDYAFLESRRNGLGEETFVQVVRGQIAYPVTDPSTGVPGMPADLVTGQDAEDVASYVAAVAGTAGTGQAAPGAAPPPATTAETETETGTETETETETEGAGGATGGGSGDAAAGKAVFASAGCVGCHTLADAGATGTVGPNLDDAKPDSALVAERVTNGKGSMPPFKGQLSEKQIEDVAAYVSGSAGK